MHAQARALKKIKLDQHSANKRCADGKKASETSRTLFNSASVFMHTTCTRVAGALARRTMLVLSLFFSLFRPGDRKNVLSPAVIFIKTKKKRARKREGIKKGVCARGRAQRGGEREGEHKVFAGVIIHTPGACARAF